ncbi:2-dehydropantoate 2-reductase [Vibrio sp. 10N.286.49.B3]|uniref:2-dehydropantoate 2-reductase n=1 Tax=Vibrio sp. 10N.286.49.B3 TaxID=1880855 RepID=UPI000C851DD1|nr:2-dehydropantoate 2-reductase [Vibrio sp. 10N.286.49.B3]PMH41153.1 2-dehydropantoate 2-reductase [Vibrio sp. 10N.286.49.B3]
MNITVLGLGAIGSLWAYHLNQAGHNVHAWTRHNQTTTSLQYDQQPSIQFASNDVNQLAHCDLLLVTVKAWQVEQALTPLLPHLHPDCILVLMHNGMGAIDDIKAQINHHPLVLATTTQAAFKPSANQVLHTGHGQTQLGGANLAGSQCQFLQDVFNHALATTKWNNSIETALWQKLAINCAINPLTALLQCNNGHLAQEQYQKQLQSITEEVAQVMQAEGINCTASQLKETIDSVIAATTKNYSSMQQDVHHQRQTEIDFITGYLLKKAIQHNIQTPENAHLFSLIKQKEPRS